MSLILKLCVSIILVSQLTATGTHLCNEATLDTVFNLGHLIYLIRSGDIWTVDTKLDDGNGLLIKDTSPMSIVSIYLGPKIHQQFHGFDKKYLNFSGFSFQELSCNHHLEDLTKTCQHNIDRYQHLTVFFTTEYAIQFRYDTEYIPLEESLILPAFMDHMVKSMSLFWPRMDVIASQYDWRETRTVTALYDSTKYRLFFVLRHGLTHCITFADMENRIYTMSTKDSERTPDWTKGHCFTGSVVGMFLYKNQTYIAGQVLAENREFEDQVYRMSVNEESKITIEAVFDESDGKQKTQNLRNMFGRCPQGYKGKSPFEH